MPELLKRVLDRAEPWAVFLAILGILLVPGVKPACWAVIGLVAVVQLVRAWRQAWTWFSLETMADVVAALLRLGLVVFGFLLLQRTWPWFVHAPPEPRFAAIYSLVARSGEGQLVLREHGSDWSVEVRPPGGGPALGGLVRRRDLWVASALGFAEPVPITGLWGLAEPAVRAFVRFDRGGEPSTIHIRGRTDTLLEANVKAR